MDLKQAHDFLELVISDVLGGMVTHEEIDTYLHRGQMWHFNGLTDIFAKTEQIHAALDVFSEKQTGITLADGVIQLPVLTPGQVATIGTKYYETFKAGWIFYYDNARQENGYEGFKILLDDEVADRRKSQILRPDVLHPIAEQTKPGKIELFPAAIYSYEVRYFRTPVAPKFVYSTPASADERVQVYDATTSVQMEWNESSMNKIILKAAQFAGVNLKESDIVSYTETKSTQNI